MSASDVSYDRDFFLWTVEQARLLREVSKAGTNLPLDWSNLAEEVESLGISDRRELRSRIATIIEHLLKLEFSPAAAPRRGWEETIMREQRNVALLLEDSPSLRAFAEGIIAAECERVGKSVAADLRRRGEIDDTTTARLQEQVLTEADVLGASRA